jgi:hypothetical protein
VPPLFWGTKNTTLHELQTGDGSRATDIHAVLHLPAGLSPIVFSNAAMASLQQFFGSVFWMDVSASGKASLR